MHRNFETAVAFTAAREGLYQCARMDEGNWTSGIVGAGAWIGTMRGISAPTLVRWLGDASLATTSRMKALTADEMSAIAAGFYWRPLNADQLPAGVDLVLFDFAFNSGIARAAKQLQIILGFSGSCLDGDIGEATIARLGAVTCSQLPTWILPCWAEQLQRDLGVPDDGLIGPTTLRAANAQNARDRMLVYALASRQEAAYRSFRNFDAFGDGWLKRLSDRVSSALALLGAETA